MNDSNDLLYEKVRKCIEEGKCNHAIVMDTGCSVSYIRYVRRYMSDPQKVKEQSKSQKITRDWKKQFAEEWEKTVRKIW